MTVRPPHALLSAALLLALCAPAAQAYSWATHMKLTRDAETRLRTDPRYAFLAQDEGMTNCFLYGSVFPDIGGMGQLLADPVGFAALKRRIEATPWVDELRLSMDQAQAVPWRSTHDPAFSLFLVEHAERWGYQPFVAFALGNLAHTGEDLHEDEFMLPYHMAATGAGDLGVGPAQDARLLGAWQTSGEVDVLLKLIGDNALTDAEVRSVATAPWRLASGGSALGRARRSMQVRAQVLHLYYLAQREWTENVLHQGPFQSEQGFQHLSGLFDALLTVYPYVVGKEPVGDAARRFKERFIDLPWWLDVADVVVDALVRILTLGQADAFDVVSAVVHPEPLAGPYLAGDPITDIAICRCHGGDLERAARARYAGNPEYQRLLASGLLDARTFASFEDGATFAVELIQRRQSSRLADWSEWPTATDPEVSHAGGIGGLAGLMGPGSGYAAEPGLVITRARFVDPATGQPVTGLHYPQDVGRALRLELQLFAPVLDPRAASGRDLLVRVRSDLRLGAADPEAARAPWRVAAAELVPADAGSVPRARIAVDLFAPADLGQEGLYLEVDAGRGIFYTSNLRAFAALTAGRPSYARDYAPYASYPPAIPITR